MPEDVQPILEDLKTDRCPRCLQPVPPQASHCPDCRQPIHSMHLLPFAIGAAGLILMMFVMLVMYRSVRNEDAATAPVAVEENADRQQDPMVPEPAANSSAKPAAKPEKRPPLDER
jgi:hypothetical protein